MFVVFGWLGFHPKKSPDVAHIVLVSKLSGRVLGEYERPAKACNKKVVRELRKLAAVLMPHERNFTWRCMTVELVGDKKHNQQRVECIWDNRLAEKAVKEEYQPEYSGIYQSNGSVQARYHEVYSNKDVYSQPLEYGPCVTLRVVPTPQLIPEVGILKRYTSLSLVPSKPSFVPDEPKHHAKHVPLFDTLFNKVECQVARWFGNLEKSYPSQALDVQYGIHCDLDVFRVAALYVGLVDLSFTKLRKLSLVGAKMKGLPSLPVLLTSLHMKDSRVEDQDCILQRLCQQDLRALTILNITRCGQRGTIPSEISNLSALTFLCLHSNFLCGTIPATISDLQSLQVLNLSNNTLHGQIPTELCKLSRLEVLILSCNNLTGKIASQLSVKDTFCVTRNHLTGQVPDTLKPFQLHVFGNKLDDNPRFLHKGGTNCLERQTSNGCSGCCVLHL